MAEPALQVRLAPRKRRQGRRIGLTALTDLVFILLIFFILETSFVEFNQLDFSQPQVETAVAAAGQGERSSGQAELETVTIQLFAGGRVWIAGETLPVDGLGGYLKARDLGPDTTVVVEAQAAAPAQLLVTALDELHAARLTKVLVRELDPTDD
jgi:biopolymer transport protein ExbD